MYFKYPDKIPNIQKELYKYAQKVVSGKTTACKKFIWACQRYIDDVNKIPLKEWEWTFNNKKAFDYIDIWVPLFKHSKGVLAGKQIELTDYERFIYGNIYGWEQKKTGIRRFRRSYEQVARKNAKSQKKAIQALYEMSAFGEPLAEIYIAATKKEQTRHVWGEAVWLYENSQYLQDSFICKHDRELKEVIIRHIKSGSFFARLSKDDRKSGDGSNPHFFILDEYHQHDTTEYYDLAISGMKTRQQPLLSIITTAGIDVNCPCRRVEYEYVSKILNPNSEIINDRYFVAICEVDINDTSEVIEIDGRRIEPGQPIDVIGSKESIKKSNPILCNDGNAIKLIQEETREAIDKPELYQKVLTKTYNIWVNQKKAGYMDMVKWSLCNCKNEDALREKIYYSGKYKPILGFDLSSTIDLTSEAIAFDLENDEILIMSHSFMPEDSIQRATDRDNVPYQLWVDQGYITATPGNDVDYHVVLDWNLKLFKKYNWKKGEACFDRALATWLEHELDKSGFIPIDIPQSYTGLSLATKTLRAKAYNRKIIHFNNPVLNWAMSNCIVRSGPSENIMLDKPASIYRIDPVASVINAMTRVIANEKPKHKGGRVIFA